MRAVLVHLRYSDDNTLVIAYVTYNDGSRREYIWNNIRLRREVFSQCTVDTVFKDDRAR